MNFFEMLLMSRKMTFVDGKITLYGQDIAIFPPPAMAEYILQINKNPKLVHLFYSACKEAMIENKEGFIQAFKTSESANWICNLINLYGLGLVKYENPSTAPLGAIIIENSAIANEFKDKTNGPVDHMLRGIIAGICSVLSNRDLDVIESECSATGGNFCKLIVDSKENLKIRFPDICDGQLNIS